MGPVGPRPRTKLLYNLPPLGHPAPNPEALLPCAATGGDLHRFAKVIAAGGANSGIFQLLVPKILEHGDYSGLKFSLVNAAKDLRYYNRMIAEVPLSANMGPQVLNSLVRAIHAGFAEGLVGDMVAAHC